MLLVAFAQGETEEEYWCAKQTIEGKRLETKYD